MWRIGEVEPTQAREMIPDLTMSGAIDARRAAAPDSTAPS
jgi:hypothetical protein